MKRIFIVEQIVHTVTGDDLLEAVAKAQEQFDSDSDIVFIEKAKVYDEHGAIYKVYGSRTGWQDTTLEGDVIDEAL